MATNKSINQKIPNVKGEEYEIWQDARFKHLVSDPRFKSLPKARRKVNIDKRFQSMFADDIFKVKYTVDKYGRKLNTSSSQDLRKFYEAKKSSGSESEETGKPIKEDERSKHLGASQENGSISYKRKKLVENDEVKSYDYEVEKTLEQCLFNPDIDYARGEGRLVTDSSSDELTDDEEDPALNIDHVWGELDAEAEFTDKFTRRLAICNMDWDRIRAVDLMVLLSSFLPAGGTLLSINIYPSEYGKKRMTEEEILGPTELINTKEKGNQKKDDKKYVFSYNEDSLQIQDSYCEEGDTFHMEKLRQYQLNRLRYYYAVAEFDSEQTANKVYEECDGSEYESSATRIDLRFIPEDFTFDDPPSDVCTSLPDNTYLPRHFITTALHQAKVNLTWDETAVERREISEKLASGKLEDIDDNDLKKIISVSSSESDNDNEIIEETKNLNENNTCGKLVTQSVICKIKKTKEDVISKYRALLAEISENENKEKTKKYEMEFSWNIEDPKVSNGNDENHQDKKNLTTIERVVLKRSKKNRKRKQDRVIKMKSQDKDIEIMNSDMDSDSIPYGIEMNDSYFTEEFDNEDFIDITSKKKSKKVRIQKQKKAEQQIQHEDNTSHLQLLVDDNDEKEQNKHFSLEKMLKSNQRINSKNKQQKLKKPKYAIAEKRRELVDSFQLNVNDDRFKAIYSDHLYNIDPTDSHFKKTKGMERIIVEKLKRRYGNKNLNRLIMTVSTDVKSKLPTEKIENNILIRNLKRKIQMKREKV